MNLFKKRILILIKVLTRCCENRKRAIYSETPVILFEIARSILMLTKIMKLILTVQEFVALQNKSTKRDL